MRFFGDNIDNRKSSTGEAKIDQSSSWDSLTDFNNKCRSKTSEGKNKRRNTYKSECALYEGREVILNAFRKGIFAIKLQGKWLRILTPKQMFQRSPIALAKAGK